MASAQAFPDSAKKQEHLEAGKRKLEEYRKKRAAAGQGKKNASTPISKTRIISSIADSHEKQPLDNGQVRFTDFDGVGTSGRVDGPVEPSYTATSISENKLTENFLNGKLVSDNGFPTAAQASMNGQGFQKDNASPSSGTVNTNYDHQLKETYNENDDTTRAERKFYGMSNSSLIAFDPQVEDIDGRSNVSSFYGLEETNLKQNDDHIKDFSVFNPVMSSGSAGGSSLQNKLDYTRPLARGPASSLYKVPTLEVEKNIHAPPESNGAMATDTEDEEQTSLACHQYSGFGPDRRSSFSHVSSYPSAESNTRRSRPSFLDSISLPRASSTSLSYSGQAKAESFVLKVQDKGAQEFSASNEAFTEVIQPALKVTPDVSIALDHHMSSSVSAGNGNNMYRYSIHENSTENKGGYYSQKQDEDFAALEQHIEDLTQEKFSLQRALEASRALAESLATENSALTDSYNQQGSVVNQLKSDMEMLQEEIKAQLVELESVKMEYANARLECNAADERAKLLASEVISLEEKALRLRSNELKLERQFEKSETEISSQKKKMSSLEKERQHLQLTIDALQEEKKLLQAKLWKASKNGKFVDVGKSPGNRRDVSTSTEGIDNSADTSYQGTIGTAPLLGSDASTSSLHPENTHFNLELSSSSIPPDQMRMIQNINTLISELAMEKEEPMQALSAASSQSLKLKELNKELSRKLESQTQRLELLTAQSMANENVRIRQPDFHSINENTAYADEGDEVVERVLGWIMKLFPGGPSRRRASKLR